MVFGKNFHLLIYRQLYEVILVYVYSLHATFGLPAVMKTAGKLKSLNNLLMKLATSGSASSDFRV